MSYNFDKNSLCHLFIAYHGTDPNKGGSINKAQEVYDTLKKDSDTAPLNIFFFPECGDREFQRTPEIAKGARLFILIVNEKVPLMYTPARESLGLKKYRDTCDENGDPLLNWLYQECESFLEGLSEKDRFLVLVDSEKNGSDFAKQVLPKKYRELLDGFEQLSTKNYKNGTTTTKIVEWVKRKLQAEIAEFKDKGHADERNATERQRIRKFLECQQKRLLDCSMQEIELKCSEYLGDYVAIPTDIDVDVTLQSDKKSPIEISNISCQRILKRKSRYERECEFISNVNTDCLQSGLTKQIFDGNEYDIKDKTFRPLFLAPPWTKGTHQSYWTLNAIDSIAVFDKTLFIGKARSGKSTTLKILTLALTEKYFRRNISGLSNRLISNILSTTDTYIPVYIDMREMRIWLKENPTRKNEMKTYFDFLASKGKHTTESCADCWSFLDCEQEGVPFYETLIGKKVLFIFDNYFDGIEMSTATWKGKDACEGGIYNFTERFPNAKFVISRRADEGREKGTEWFSDFTKIYLKEFDENSVFDFFVNKRLQCTSNEKIAAKNAQLLRRELNELGFGMGSLDSPRFLTKLIEYANIRYAKSGDSYFFVPKDGRTELTKTVIIRRCLYAIISDIAKETDNSPDPIITNEILHDVKVFDKQKRSQQSRTSFQWYKALLCKIANKMMVNSLNSPDSNSSIHSSEIEDAIEEMNIGRTQQAKKDKIISLLSGKNGLLVRVIGNATNDYNDDIYEFENKLFYRYLVAKDMLTNERLLETLFSIVFNNRLQDAVDDKNIDYLERVICLLLLRKQQVAIKDVNPYSLLIWTLLSEIINPESKICDNNKYKMAQRVWLACRVLAADGYELLTQDEDEQSAAKELRVLVHGKLRSAIKEQLSIPIHTSSLTVNQRIDIGNVLGRLGDDRKGVGVVKGLPDIDWVDIEGGEFVFGLSDEKCAKLIEDIKEHESKEPGYCNNILGLGGVEKLSIKSFSRETPARLVTLKPFKISKHLITNIQFNAFVVADDGMYSSDWKKWYGWSPASEKYHNTIMSDLNKKAEVIFYRKRECAERQNYPAIAVSWFDAVAFCKWLSQKTGKKIRLATESEWECAAGMNEKFFVWGDEIDMNRCNNGLHRFNQVCPVGTFAHDEHAVSSCEEMNGNVWEWTQSFYGNTHLDSDEDHDSIVDIDENNEISHSSLIAVKGGSFLNKMQSMRNTYRGRDAAGDNFTRHGFRIVEIAAEQDFKKVKAPKNAAYSHIIDDNGEVVWYLTGYANNQIRKGDKVKLYSEACFYLDERIDHISSSTVVDISTANLNIENHLKIIKDEVFDAIITVGDGTVVHKAISDMVVNFPNATTFWPKQKVEEMFCGDWWCSNGSIRKGQVVQFRIYIKEII